MNHPTPVLAIVGRPNVGKSTLFNRLTASRAALVADIAGLTRDRHYGRGVRGDRSFVVIDTGGFEPVAREGLTAAMARQTRQAVIEADLVLFVVDGRAGVTGHDREIAAELRRTATHWLLVVNKTEGMIRDRVTAEFHELGLGDPYAISAAHGDAVGEVVDLALERIDESRGVRVAGAEPAVAGDDDPTSGDGEGASDHGEAVADRGEADVDRGEAAAVAAPAAAEGAPAAGPAAIVLPPRRIRIAIVGRPNGGKSTLINALVGEERVIAFDLPGTTRDAVAIDFERNGRPYTLVDTAGLRRRGKIHETIEKFSVVKTLQAIEDSNVCVLVLDGEAGITDQDANIAGYILEAGRALVVAVNKWDRVPAADRDRLKNEFDRKLHFLRFARVHMISALHGHGLGALLRSAEAAYAAAISRLSTPKLTRSMNEAVARQAPPRRGPIRPKLRYAHQGGQNPPVVVIHGNSLDSVPDTYRRYLEGWFREHFKLEGTPLRIEFRSQSNPYVR